MPAASWPPAAKLSRCQFHQLAGRLPTWILDTWLVYLQSQMCSSAPGIVTLGLLFPLEMDRSGGLQLDIGL